MVFEERKTSEYVIVDTSAFIRNANLQDIGEKIITVPEVVNEIKSKRQLRRLVVLPYDLQIKEAFPESIQHVAEFAKKTGDYPSLSATDLKVLALTYQLEKEHVGVSHLKTVPEVNRSVEYCNYSAITAEDIAGFYKPKKGRYISNSESSEVSDCSKVDTEHDEELQEKFVNCNINDDANSEYHSASSDSDEFVDSIDDLNNGKPVSITETSDANNETIEELIKDTQKSLGCDLNHLDEASPIEDILKKVDETETEECSENELNSDPDDDDDDGEDDCQDDDNGWITPSNIKKVKQEMDGDNLDEKPVAVACLTMDFAMQNVLKQMGLNVLSLDGRVIKQMRTFILRCYSCFKTTSIMTKVFCHHCGNKTLKKVAVSLDANGKQKIHINLRRPLTARGKKFSLPKPTGGKHSTFPLLFEDQPVPDQRPTRLAKTKTNPLDPDYIAGFSPFAMRDVNSKSAVLGVQNRSKDVKYWMRKNPNESSGKKRKK